MTGLFVVLGCTLVFFLAAQIFTLPSTYDPNNNTQRAKCSNKLEKKVYDTLRFKGYYLIVQYKVPNKRFKLDFTFFSPNGLKIDVEIDGPFHRTPEGIKRDRRRDKYMKTNCWKVIRITDISLNNGFEKQILLLMATLNKLGVEPSQESDLVLLEQE
ncbi:hypothetical protein CN271_00950 [Bacillus cereus]|uniref:endonuclease domain-containing protein n=1 Tax=Bacillus cereus TaxID=1396 RepID=UPI000BEE29C9|nr:DUF559 domain-containing protein [Bacillus cereus]PEE33581.1 hypothetical protein CON59_24785 [Bacillus cereus]PET34091.1 hypothetical protein CN523_31755 [Bacillus cereus]PEV70211.1 hypothetical protein CN429_31035 [Bacillus cereus]PFA53198.1 hypothetical protein CN389_20400 [Bacillus cereus]PFD80704.1 hypothetical protein CN271_00950 [Bacillus cereus]